VGPPQGEPIGMPQKPTKYRRLTEYLMGLDSESVTLTFDQLRDILGFKLPDSASNHPAWWQEGGTHSQARGWRNAGWSVVRADRSHKRVTFRRDAPGSVGGSQGQAVPPEPSGQLQDVAVGAPTGPRPSAHQPKSQRAKATMTSTATAPRCERQLAATWNQARS